MATGRVGRSSCKNHLCCIFTYWRGSSLPLLLFRGDKKKSAVKVNKLEEIDIKNFNFLEKASKGKNSKTWKTDIMTIKEREGSVCTKCLAKLECS